MAPRLPPPKFSCSILFNVPVTALPSKCWISATEGRVSCDLRGTLGLWQRGGGVRHVSTSSSLSTLRGTSSPTSRRSVESSSMPRPSHRPQGNLPAYPAVMLHFRHYTTPYGPDQAGSHGVWASCMPQNSQIKTDFKFGLSKNVYYPDDI
jgi:transposase